MYVVTYEEHWVDNARVVNAGTVKEARALVKRFYPHARKLFTRTWKEFERERTSDRFDKKRWNAWMRDYTAPAPGEMVAVPSWAVWT